MPISRDSAAPRPRSLDAPPVVEVAGIEVTLGDRPILRNLHLCLRQNEKWVISGESGSGKSTLLKTLIGRVRPSRGRIAICGETLTAASLTAIRARMCYVPQEIQCLGDETCREFLAAPYALAVNREARFTLERAHALFDTVGLAHRLMEHRLRDLSGGERKRLGIVSALLLNRPILLMDEPTASVDEENRQKLGDAILGLRDTTLLAVSHDAGLVARAARTAVLEAGCLAKREA